MYMSSPQWVTNGLLMVNLTKNTSDLAYLCVYPLIIMGNE